jgi:hypothetical protein
MKKIKSRKSKSKNRRQTRKYRRGGSYYSYNKNPLLFTNTTTQMGGTDPRSTMLPQSLVNLARTTMENGQNSINASKGIPPVVPSDVLIQPINYIHR